jgi:hypothetical protein
MTMRSFTLAIVLAVLIATIAGGSAAHAATAPPGGANQRASLEGCMNQWLFNGVWRMRVTGFEPVDDFGTKGIGVKVEARNGTTKTLALGTSGVDGQGQGVDLVTTDGDAMTLDASGFQTSLGYKQVVQGGAAKAELHFHFQNPADAAAGKKPGKLIVQFNQKSVQVPGVKYTTKTPSLRFNLTCDKAAKPS